MAIMKIKRRAGRASGVSGVKGLMGDGFGFRKALAELFQLSSEYTVTFYQAGDISASTHYIHHPDIDCEVKAVRIRARTAGAQGTGGTTDGTAVVKVNGSGIHTASALNVTTLIKPALTSTAVTADQAIEVTFVAADGTGPTQPANVIVEVTLSRVKDTLTNPSA